MSFFSRHNGQLYAEQIPLAHIADQVGTPCYVYSRAALSAQFLAYQNAEIPQQKLVCYAVKANSNIALLNVLAQLGAGFDIVSLGELQRVIKAGGDPQKIVFSGVGKQAEEMAYALDLGIHCFNVESDQELETLNQVAGRLGKIAPISLRVNPDVDAKTHPYISTGLKDNKFGVDFDSALSIYRRAAALENIRITGIDCHIGSQLTELSPFLDALDRILSLVDQLAAEGITLHHLDLGGGLGVRYQNEEPPHPAEYLKQVSAHLGSRDLSLIFEPGRSIVANAGVFLTRVLYLKHAEHKNFAVVDGAMNDMLRPALYSAWMEIANIETRERAPLTYDIVGPVCETGDFLAKERDLSLDQEDVLCLFSAGAYGFTMSSNYNTRGRAAEVMVDGDNFHIIRQRETFEDMVRGETLLPE